MNIERGCVTFWDTLYLLMYSFMLRIDFPPNTEMSWYWDSWIPHFFLGYMIVLYWLCQLLLKASWCHDPTFFQFVQKVGWFDMEYSLNSSTRSKLHLKITFLNWPISFNYIIPIIVMLLYGFIYFRCMLFQCKLIQLFYPILYISGLVIREAIGIRTQKPSIYLNTGYD